MKDACPIRTYFSIRELTRFTSAAVAWAVSATAVTAIVLSGASAGVPPFNMLGLPQGSSQSETDARATPGPRTNPDKAESAGNGEVHIKDAGDAPRGALPYSEMARGDLATLYTRPQS